MASPFKIFRRNQKVMLAVVGVLVMFAFVFLDPRFFGISSRNDNPEVVKTKYETLRNSQLQLMIAKRHLVDQFLRQISDADCRAWLDAQTEQFHWTKAQQDQMEPRVRYSIEQLYRVLQYNLLERPDNRAERAAVETMLLAKKAEELGMVVDDDDINAYIREITSDSVLVTVLRITSGKKQLLDGKKLAEVIDRLRFYGQRTDQDVLFDALKQELLAQRVTALTRANLGAIPPGERWDYFLRLNRRATVELAPISVNYFVKDVPDPKEDELLAFFQAHKDALPIPNSPEPAFKQPTRASFEYFKGNYATFVDDVKVKVTDKDIQKYYDEHKENFPYKEPSATKEDESQSDEEKSDDAAEEKPGEEPAADKSGDSTKPVTAPAPADPKKAADIKAPATKGVPAAPQPGVKKPATTTPPTAKPPAKGVKQPAAGKSSLHLPPASQQPQAAVKLVSDSMAQASPKKQPAATAKPPAAATTKPAPAATKPTQPATPAKGAPGKATDDKPAKVDADADKTAATHDSAEESASDETEQPAEEKPKYQPLEDVRDDIRKAIAREQADQQIKETMSELKDVVDTYFGELGDAKQSDSKRPKKPDFQELARKRPGITLEKTPLITLYQAYNETDIGKAGDFLRMAFGENSRLNKPEQTTDPDKNEYLFWKTGQEEEYVPKLDDVRDQVIKTWKGIQARELAQKRAQKYAAVLRGSDQPLEEFVAAHADDVGAIVKPPEFSWLSTGYVSPTYMERPRLSEVDGVTGGAGADFMRAVFDLSEGDVGTAMNRPQDTIYLVKAISFQPSQEQLHRYFASEDPGKYLAAAEEDHIRVAQDFFRGLEADAQLKWLREPSNQMAFQNE